jgi:hypothetical protein
VKLLTRADLPFVAALAASIVLYSSALFDFGRVPYEDAAMLMRYASHVAGGHGIVWNVGEAPVDGATDFLFMALVAALVKAGISPEAATRALGFVSHALTVFLVYASIVRYAGGRRWIALPSAAFVALGPGLRYVEAYFGTTFFAFLGSLTWYFALALITGTPTRKLSWGFTLAALATGLTRPEGVFLSAIILVAIVCAKGWRASAPIVRCFLLVFAVAGGAYLGWRKIYFGYLLPNPFYAKGGGELHATVLLQSIRNAATLLLPLVPVFVFVAVASVATLVKPRLVLRLLRPAAGVLLALFVLGLLRTSHPGHPIRLLGRYSPSYAIALAALLAGAVVALGVDAWVRGLRARGIPAEQVLGTSVDRYAANLRRWTAIALIPLAGYTAIWILIQDFMNYLMRFQYVLLPIACMVWPLPFVRASETSRTQRSFTRGQRVLAVMLGTALVVGSVGLQRSMMTVLGRFHDGRFDMARMLNVYSGRGYTMATTEAGLLPYYSEWNAVDVYGYNDRWIAHHGLSEAYLDRRHPELIVIAGTYPLAGGRPAIGILQHYVEKNDYVLAAAYGGDRTKVHYYYVRRGFADTDALVQSIRDLDYGWYMSGRTAIDFAAE